MKKTVHIILALAIGIIIGMADTVFAAGEVVEATFAKFQYIINGEPVELEADALVYQGSTYLPVRALLNALGYDVTYKADSRTIEADKSIETLFEEIEKSTVTENPQSGVVSLEDIDREIRKTEILLNTAKGMLKTAIESGDAEMIEKAEQYIAENEQKLTDLERKKADLAQKQ